MFGMVVVVVNVSACGPQGGSISQLAGGHPAAGSFSI